MKATAFSPAEKYLEAGLALLGRTAWIHDYKLALNLSCASAEAEYCNGKFDEMQSHLDEAIAHCQTFDDKIRAYMTLIQSLGVRQRFDEGIDTGIYVL